VLCHIAPIKVRTGNALFWISGCSRSIAVTEQGTGVLKPCKTTQKKGGALYYEINCDGWDDRMRFWKSIGFVENGVDEYGVPLPIKR